ncbi:uncharacterized protein zgc:113149 isoform X3 [Dunckerocampus dactyliophorus]|uniref:uncharacterized protein zgc:113149 isoform X3 n=1 Tax=Dunckerocampus dactyliophorus TaxID=161453 RepID=UPI002404EC90|nr:uncharacterized protein zgc:113149 isoform X3 [Dunckerocampus dactyliophorus]
MVRTCNYPGCNNKNESPYAFHRFPVTDIAIRQLWLLAIGYSTRTKVARMKELRVCNAHFSEDDYVPKDPGKRKKRILKSSAVPTPQASSPFAMAATTAQSEASFYSNPEEVDQVFSGLPQSTPLESRDKSQQLKLVLTSPAETVLRTKPSTSGTYLAPPPTWTQSQKMGPKRKQSVEQKRLASRVRMRAYRARQAFKRAAAANHLFLQRLNFAASEDLVGGDSDWMPSRADYEVDTSVPAMSTSWNEEDDDFKVGGARGLRSKPRFSFSEVKLLLEAVRENRYILLRKFNHGVSSEAKKQKWAEITDQINNLGQNYREVRQIMKKWADLKCDGKRRLLALHAPNGSAERRRRKSSLGPVEKMVHEILLLSPKREGNSDVNLGGEDEDSKLSMEQGGNMSPSYPYPAPNSTLALPGGLSLDFSPLSSPEKEHSGDPFHSSSDFDQQEDAEPSMDFDDNDNSTSTFSYRSSFLPPTDNAQASSKPIQTYSRNQNYNATTSKAHGPPLFESDAASSPAAPLPSYSPSGANIRACTSSSSSPLAPPTTSLAANGSSQPISSYSSIPPPSNHLASSHIKHAQASDQTQPDHLPSGHKAQSRVAQLACLSVQQQRATRHLLSSVSRSLETLAQSVQLLVESQQEFVQESLLLQRETVDILKDFSNTALTMMRDKSNSGQARHPSASNI